MNSDLQDELVFARTYEEGLRYIKRGASRVKMRELRISNSEVLEIAHLVETNNTLRHLDLGKNKIGDPGIKALAKALVSNYALEELILSRNIIGLHGATALAEALKVNNTLVKLNLANNGVGPQGAAALREALMVNSGLSWLKLSANGIGEDECRLLVDVISKNNRRITALGMDDNGMSDITEERLTHTLRGNNRLKADREKIQKDKLESLVRNGLAVSEFRRCRLFTIGQGRVGKTATVRSLLSLPFNPEWDSTIGAEIKYAYAFPNRVWAERKPTQSNTAEMAIRIAAEKSKNIRTDNVKLAKPAVAKPPPETSGGGGQEEAPKERELSPAEVRRQQRLAALERRANVQLGGGKSAPKKKSVPTLALLDRSEVAQVLKQPSLGKELKIQSEALCFNIWDFGGQDVFYTLHHLFLTRHGIYLFVFDLREVVPDASDSSKAKAKAEAEVEAEEERGNEGDFSEYFKFWLNSVQMHASGAPVVLAGTFADVAVSGNIEAMEKHIQKVVRASGGGSASIIKNTTNNLSFFPVDNSSGTGIKNLAATLSATAESQEYVHRLVSMRWMKCLDEIMAIKPARGQEASDKLKQIRRGRVGAEGGNGQLQQRHDTNPPGPLDAEELQGLGPAEQMERIRAHRLRQLLGKGKRLNEDKGSVQGGKKETSDWVTLGEVKERGRECGIQSAQEIDDMLALFHALGMIVHLTSTEALRSIVTVQPQWLVDAISKVIRDGRIHGFEQVEISKARLGKDVKKMFDKALVSQDLLEFLWKENGQSAFLLDLMRRSMLLSEWGFDGEDLYLCPSLLKSSSAVNDASMQDATYTCLFDFAGSFLPIGVYERLICLCVAQSGKVAGSVSPQLSKDTSKIWLGPTDAFVILQKGNGIELSTDKVTMAKKMHGIVSSILRKIKEDVMSNGLKWETKVKVDRGWVPFSEAVADKVQPWYSPESAQAEALPSRNLEDFLTCL